eukprot:CAMPEP_0180518150 /NCGR_PEP_ID=MMETSP1036_2-20121128/54933_1 /TAXON_ID=632150 /ORGANISM="Azadinium spinosum, Strain 3D9" /LENGTH=111 /DNA_ID=CAMNT_0022530267 /DNA_START=130 /DNA_END=461 /DNA_ORIENTATION=-
MIGWSSETAPGPHDPPQNYSVPPSNAAAVLRGPLLYALPLKEDISVVKVWPPFNNTDVNMFTKTPWNMALKLDTLQFARRGCDMGVLPWDPAGVRSVITAVGCTASDWKET